MDQNKTWDQRWCIRRKIIYSGLLVDENPTGVVVTFFGAADIVAKSVSNNERKSIAAALTDLDGDARRLIIGKTNTSSSLKEHEALPITYSADTNNRIVLSTLSSNVKLLHKIEVRDKY